MNLGRLGMGVRQIVAGAAVFFMTAGLVAGSFLLAESERLMALPSTAPISEATATTAAAPNPTWPPGTATSAPTLSAEAPTPVSPTPTTGLFLYPSCAPPPGWRPYWVRAGDTLSSLALLGGVTPDVLVDVNCLDEATVAPGLIIYLPAAFFVTPTSEPCGVPPGWVLYIVQRGDTLFNLARRLRVSVEMIQRANCMETTAIYVGKPLYLPAFPPSPTPVVIPTPVIITPSPTPTFILTPTPTPTFYATPSPTFYPTATWTPFPTLTPTSPLTQTATPTFTPSPTSTPSPIVTGTPTATPSPTSTPTSTPSPLPTATPTSTPAPSPTSTSVPLPTSTPTPTPTSTPGS